MIFMWNHWNVDHIGDHGVMPQEAEEIVRRMTPPFPRDIGHGKLLVWGQTRHGRYLQVVYVNQPDEKVDFESLRPEDLLAYEDGDDILYVIHAMPMTERQKSHYRRL